MSGQAQEFSFHTPDENVRIYATGWGDMAASSLVLLVPGLGGSRHDLLVNAAGEFFSQAGYFVLALDMYGKNDDQRNLVDCDVESMAADISIVVANAKERFSPNICAIGHSYAGMSLVHSAVDIDAAILWDPTHSNAYNDTQRRSQILNSYSFIPELNAWISTNGRGKILSAKVFEADRIDSDSDASEFDVDTLVINADCSAEMVADGSAYTSHIAGKTKHLVIEDSDHNFYSKASKAKLFQGTLSWLIEGVGIRI